MAKRFAKYMSKCVQPKILMWLDDGDFPIFLIENKVEIAKNANRKKRRNKYSRKRSHSMWWASHVMHTKTVTANANIKSDSIRKWPKSHKIGENIVLCMVWIYRTAYTLLVTPKITKKRPHTTECYCFQYIGYNFSVCFSDCRSVDCHFLIQIVFVLCQNQFFFFTKCVWLKLIKNVLCLTF